MLALLELWSSWGSRCEGKAGNCSDTCWVPQCSIWGRLRSTGKASRRRWLLSWDWKQQTDLASPSISVHCLWLSCILLPPFALGWKEVVGDSNMVRGFHRGRGVQGTPYPVPSVLRHSSSPPKSKAAEPHGCEQRVGSVLLSKPWVSTARTRQAV